MSAVLYSAAALFGGTIIIFRLISKINRSSLGGPRSCEVKCTCGKVTGKIVVQTRNIPSAECYCKDCRAFALWMTDVKKSPVQVTNAAGGSLMLQIFKDEISILKGKENIACVKLTPHAPLYRFYTTCCNTPFGLKPKLDCYPMIVCYPCILQGDDIWGPTWWRLNCASATDALMKDDSAITDDGLSMSFIAFTLGRFLYGILFGRNNQLLTDIKEGEIFVINK